MSDPFAEDFGALEIPNVADELESDFATDGSGILLPLSLALVVYVGALMPWVVVRPLNQTANTFNLTDVPGGIGILVTSVVFVVTGAILLGFKKRVGLVLISLSVICISWMATISGLLLGVVGSLIPSIKVLGIDLAKAQVGQGTGVAVSLVAGLLLGMLTIRKYEPISNFSPGFNIRILPIIAIIPLLVVTVNFHSPWLVLGNDETALGAEIPGDSLYGSGLLLLLMYLGMGMWFLALIVRTRLMNVWASIVSGTIASICGMFALFVWIGGKTLQWLLPGSLDKWTSISSEPPLFITLVAASLLFVLSIAGFFPQVEEKSIGVGNDATIASRKISMSDLVGTLVIFATILIIAVNKLV